MANDLKNATIPINVDAHAKLRSLSKKNNVSLSRMLRDIVEAYAFLEESAVSDKDREKRIEAAAKKKKQKPIEIVQNLVDQCLPDDNEIVVVLKIPKSVANDSSLLSAWANSKFNGIVKALSK